MIFFSIRIEKSKPSHYSEHSYGFQEEEVWLPPGRNEINLRHGIRGKHALLEVNNQNGVPEQVQSLIDMGFSREICVEAMQAEEGFLDAAIEYLLNKPLPQLQQSLEGGVEEQTGP